MKERFFSFFINFKDFSEFIADSATIKKIMKFEVCCKKYIITLNMCSELKFGARRRTTINFTVQSCVEFCYGIKGCGFV